MTAHDPESLYRVDLLTGAREGGDARTMLESYVRAAAEVAKQTDNEFFAQHGEVSRIIGHLPGTPDENATRIVDLHRRHAEDVENVLDEGIRSHAKDLRKGKLPESSLLMLALPRGTIPPPSSQNAPPPSSASSGPVRILHLADFHFSRHRAWDQDPVLTALHRDVSTLVSQALRPDLVAITGDVADR